MKMTNKTILNQLEKNYSEISSRTLPQIVITTGSKKDKKTTRSDSKIVPNSEWKRISDGRIDLIIVADNPGETEKENGIYLHPTGNAGKPARKFINYYRSLSRRKGQVLIMNKTPYWSNNSTSLEESTGGNVKTSVELTFNSIVELWELNPEVHILVVGLNPDADLNKYFFELFHDCENVNFKKSVFFGLHPSYGHLALQLADALVSEIKTKRRIKVDRILKRIHEQNRTALLKAYDIRI